MRRTKHHGPGDTAAAVIVIVIAGLVFWLVPPSHVQTQAALAFLSQT
jgi:hypothetical protein